MKEVNIDDKYIRYFGGVHPVRGVNKSLIYDMHRYTAFHIPTLLYDVLTVDKNHTIRNLKQHYSNDYDEGIDLYLDFLVNKELVFLTDKPESFPGMNFEWDTPNRITCSILEFSDLDTYDVKNAMDQLESLGCIYLQMRLINSKICWEELASLIEGFDRSRFKLIELILPFEHFSDAEQFSTFLNKNLRVVRISFYGAPNTKILESNNSEILKSVRFYTNEINYGQSDIVQRDSFTYNLSFFTEALKYNVALNRKICVDHQGNMKNYLNHSTDYGNIKNRSIADVIGDKAFQTKWHINNDSIEKCKDCQFRYACLSNSDIKENEGKWYKMEQCQYDPYSDEWND